MHRIVLLLAVLSAIVPQTNFTSKYLLLLAVLSAIVPQTNFTNIEESPTSTTTMAPTVFKNPKQAVTPKPRRSKNKSPILNHIFDNHAAKSKHIHDKFGSPSFDDANSSDGNIEANTGATVSFNCSISSLRDKLMSWVKVSDVRAEMQLLTLDLTTHTADSRYRVDLGGENWRLILRDVKVEDSGVYCCQISTHPPLLKHFKLTVYPPEIKLTTEAFLETSETLSLKCIILHLDPGDTKPVLHWYRGNSTVPMDEMRGGVYIETDLINLTSHLQVALVKMEDAGNYTCSLEAPLRMKAVARVHVLQGSSLAELQSGVKGTTSYLSLLMASLLLVFGSNVDVR